MSPQSSGCMWRDLIADLRRSPASWPRTESRCCEPANPACRGPAEDAPSAAASLFAASPSAGADAPATGCPAAALLTSRPSPSLLLLLLLRSKEARSGSLRADSRAGAVATPPRERVSASADAPPAGIPAPPALYSLRSGNRQLRSAPLPPSAYMPPLLRACSCRRSSHCAVYCRVPLPGAWLPAV